MFLGIMACFIQGNPLALVQPHQRHKFIQGTPLVLLQTHQRNKLGEPTSQILNKIPQGIAIVDVLRNGYTQTCSQPPSRKPPNTFPVTWNGVAPNNPTAGIFRTHQYVSKVVLRSSLSKGNQNLKFKIGGFQNVFFKLAWMAKLLCLGDTNTVSAAVRAPENLCRKYGPHSSCWYWRCP